MIKRDENGEADVECFVVSVLLPRGRGGGWGIFWTTTRRFHVWVSIFYSTALDGKGTAKRTFSFFKMGSLDAIVSREYAQRSNTLWTGK